MNALCVAMYLKYLCGAKLKDDFPEPRKELDNFYFQLPDFSWKIGYYISPATKAAIDALEKR